METSLLRVVCTYCLQMCDMLGFSGKSKENLVGFQARSEGSSSRDSQYDFQGGLGKGDHFTINTNYRSHRILINTTFLALLKVTSKFLLNPDCTKDQSELNLRRSVTIPIIFYSRKADSNCFGRSFLDHVRRRYYCGVIFPPLRTRPSRSK